ncbi:MAG: ABC transporter permease [Phycisphaerales bacterium]
MGRIDEIRELTRMRTLGFLREPEAIFWVFLFPIVMAVVLGFAFRRGAIEQSVVGMVSPVDVATLAEAVAPDSFDDAGSGLSDASSDASSESSSTAASDAPPVGAPLEARLHWPLDLTLRTFPDRETAMTALQRAEVDVLVEVIDPDAADETAGADAIAASDANTASATNTPELRVTLDPTQPKAAAAELRVRRELDRAAGIASTPVAREAIEKNGYIDFLFPGLLGMNLMGTGMWGIGFGIADIRRRKLLKRLMVTPMRRSSFFLGFINARLIFLGLEVGLLVAFALLILGVPFRGDVFSFAIVSVFGAATFAGIGILIAARAKTIEGVSGLMNAVMVPMWLASGVFFPYERFPEAIHPVLELLPLTALNNGLRGVMLDGASVAQLLPELGIMAAWGGLAFAVALRIFRWN